MIVHFWVIQELMSDFDVLEFSVVGIYQFLIGLLQKRVSVDEIDDTIVTSE